MSYLISILPATDSKPFTLEEVAQAVRSCEGYAFREAQHGDGGEATILIKRAGGLQAALHLTGGEIVSKNPETDVLAAMIELAKQLGGRVRGECGETYRTPDDTYEHPDDAEKISQWKKQSAEASRKSQRKRILRAMLPALLVVVILILKAPWLWPKPATFPKQIDAAQSAPAVGPVGRFDIVLLPLADFDYGFANKLSAELSGHTNLRVAAVKPFSLDGMKPYPGSSQFDAARIVHQLGTANEIQRVRRLYHASTVIVLTNRDLNVGERHTRFLYSYGDYSNRVSVVSAHRLVAGTLTAYTTASKIEDRVTKFALRGIAEHRGMGERLQLPDLINAIAFSANRVPRIRYPSAV